MQFWEENEVVNVFDISHRDKVNKCWTASHEEAENEHTPTLI